MNPIKSILKAFVPPPKAVAIPRKTTRDERRLVKQRKRKEIRAAIIADAQAQGLPLPQVLAWLKKAGK